MIILVCGGREFNDYDRLKLVLDGAAGLTRGDISIINGASRGADQLSTQWAKERGYKYVEFYADWEKFGKAAGPIRNQQMIDSGKPDMAIIFPGGNGTLDMLSRIFFAGIPATVVGKTS